jgi:hypothetical protein
MGQGYLTRAVERMSPSHVNLPVGPASAPQSKSGCYIRIADMLVELATPALGTAKHQSFVQCMRQKTAKSCR